MLSAGSRQLSRSPNPGSPERDRTQCRRILVRAGEHIIDVGAGNDEARTEADQLALQRDIVADAADTQHLAVRPAGLRDALIGLAQARVVDLPGDTVIRRQVARANQQHVDPGQGCDRRGIVDALGGFQHDDQRGITIEAVVQLAERRGAITERRPTGGKRQLRTTASASPRLLTCGTITPCAPPSSTRLDQWASWPGTRTSGVMPMPSAAAQIVEVVSIE